MLLFTSLSLVPWRWVEPGPAPIVLSSAYTPIRSPASWQLKSGLSPLPLWPGLDASSTCPAAAGAGEALRPARGQ